MLKFNSENSSRGLTLTLALHFDHCANRHGITGCMQGPQISPSVTIQTYSVSPTRLRIRWSDWLRHWSCVYDSWGPLTSACGFGVENPSTEFHRDNPFHFSHASRLLRFFEYGLRGVEHQVFTERAVDSTWRSTAYWSPGRTSSRTRFVSPTARAFVYLCRDRYHHRCVCHVPRCTNSMERADSERRDIGDKGEQKRSILR